MNFVEKQDFDAFNTRQKAKKYIYIVFTIYFFLTKLSEWAYSNCKLGSALYTLCDFASIANDFFKEELMKKINLLLLTLPLSLAACDGQPSNNGEQNPPAVKAETASKMTAQQLIAKAKKEN